MSDIKPKSNKKLIIGLTSTIIAVVAYLSFGTNSQVQIIENTESSLNTDAIKPLTLADAWQGVKIKKTAIPTVQEVKDSIKNSGEDEEKAETPITLDYEYIHEEIGKIRLTENGDVVIDGHTLNALRQAFPSSRLKLTPAMLEELQAIMKEGLPAPAGEQAADIIKNFYDYAVAKREMDTIYRDVSTNLSHEEALAEEKVLRNLYLGEEVANELFAVEDRNSEYMLKAFEISADENLSKEEKIEKRNELKHSYIEPLIDNWSDRYSEYKEEANKLKASDLDQKALRAELDKLKSERFNKEELDIIVGGNIILD